MLKHGLTGLAATFMLTLPSSAQDAATVELPDICTAAMPHDMGSMGSMDMEMHGMPASHQDLAKGMPQFNARMMQGMAAEDIDVAFVCAMIPHHQGAISMARAELEHGDDEWARAMASKVIEAQEKEIGEMLAWLKEQK